MKRMAAKGSRSLAANGGSYHANVWSMTQKPLVAARRMITGWSTKRRKKVFRHRTHPHLLRTLLSVNTIAQSDAEATTRARMLPGDLRALSFASALSAQYNCADGSTRTNQTI